MDIKLQSKIIKRAEAWLNDANQSLSQAEKKQQEKIKTLIKRPENKFFLVQLLDQCFRTKKSTRIFRD